MIEKPFTQKDIAKQLNISITTVSRALQDHPSISLETKKRVVELANKINYHPNSIALSLVKSKTCTIGVIVPEVAHSYFSLVMEGIEEAAIQAGYTIMFCLSHESLQREIEVINTLVSNRIDGLLVAPTKETIQYDHFEAITTKGIPLVFFDRHCEGLSVSKVLIDDYHGAFNAVEHLIQQGCTRIAHMAGPTTLSNSRQRLAGYMDALKTYRIDITNELIYHSNLTKEDVLEGIKKLLDAPQMPDAIFAYNSSIAFEGMNVVKDRGLTIPNEIAFVGFANEPIISYTEPQLTTIMQPAFELGQQATQLLLDQIKSDPANFKAATNVLKTSLVIRSSSLRKQ